MIKVMEFDSQYIKELLESGANLIIDDQDSEEELQYMAKLARENERNLTIIAGRWHLEALKRIARSGEGFVTFDIREARKRK